MNKNYRRAAESRKTRTYGLQMVGPGDVGKSALTVQFIQNSFVDEYDPTIEDAYRKQCVIDEELACIDVLDTAGQEEYAALREHYFAYGDGFALVYSITQRDSFEAIQDFWQQISRMKDLEPFPAILVGNKCDLEYERQVLISEGRELAHQLGCELIETSAKYRINVDQTFCKLVRAVRKARGSRAGKPPHDSSRCIIT